MLFSLILKTILRKEVKKRKPKGMSLSFIRLAAFLPASSLSVAMTNLL